MMDGSTLGAAIGLMKKIPKGDKGDAATISVGSVSSGAQPAVTNSGTSAAAVLDFVIPSVLISDDNNGNVTIN